MSLDKFITVVVAITISLLGWFSHNLYSRMETDIQSNKEMSYHTAQLQAETVIRLHELAKDNEDAKGRLDDLERRLRKVGP